MHLIAFRRFNATIFFGIHSFHVKGTERIWCLNLPNEGVMFVMWWDPNHKVYNVPLKGT